MLTRRDVLAGLGAVAAWPLRADVAVGGGMLTTISDGALILPGDFAFGQMPQAELAEILAAHDLPRDEYRAPCNVTLYRDGTNTVLFDVGSGPDFLPSAGDLLDNLDAADVTPDDITHVVFTHAHPDHIWGLLDDFDDPAFPNATYFMGAEEWEYWSNPETVNTIGQDRASFAAGAKRRMEAIEDAVTRFKTGDEILPGIAALASFGHTPGHMAFELPGALIVGDAIGNGHVAFARPEWRSGADQEPDAAIAARKMLLSRAADEQSLLIGFHLPHGGMGRVARTDGQFQFIEKDT